MFKREIIDTSFLSPPPATKPATVMIANATCACGKVKARIQTSDDSSTNFVAPAPIRLVCYCRDCRGYFETLNRKQCCKITKNVSGEEEEIEEVEETSIEPERKTTLTSETDVSFLSILTAAVGAIVSLTNAFLTIFIVVFTLMLLSIVLGWCGLDLLVSKRHSNSRRQRFAQGSQNSARFHHSPRLFNLLQFSNVSHW